MHAGIPPCMQTPPHACRYHSLALTSFGVLYSWGCGENGQLGHHEDADVFFPKVIEPNVGTVVGQISCGEHHTAVLTSTPWSRVDPEVAGRPQRRHS